jgi:Winged helix DNA-binding domain
VDPAAIVARRMHRQRLVGERFGDLGEALAFFCATQGQDYAEAKWSLGQRIDGVDDATLDAAFDAGEILRTHVLRPTWHLVTPRDIRWMLDLTAPRVHRALGTGYRRLGLDDDDFARGHEAIERALEPGEPLILDELIEALEAAGITGERLRHTHVVIHAELEALICSGPRRGRRHTYMLLEDRAPDAIRLERDEALAELTRRYFQSHAPATVRDFSWWSGLTAAEAKRGIERAGLGPDEDGWYGLDIGDGDDAPSEALLIGMFDESVIAYQDLRFAFGARPEELEPLIRPVLIGARTVGTWRRVTERDRVTVEATFFKRPSAAERGSFAAATERYGGFLGIKTQPAIV